MKVGRGGETPPRQHTNRDTNTPTHQHANTPNANTPTRQHATRNCYTGESTLRPQAKHSETSTICHIPAPLKHEHPHHNNEETMLPHHITEASVTRKDERVRTTEPHINEASVTRKGERERTTEPHINEASVTRKQPTRMPQLSLT